MTDPTTSLPPEPPSSSSLPHSVPQALSPLAATASGAAWLARLPELLKRASERWNLETGPPFSSGSASWTAIARRRGEPGWPLVLKIAFPHSEAEREADALLHWHGHGAPRLVDIDLEDWALLMVALQPGTPLSAGLWRSDDALLIGARVLAELHGVAPAVGHPFSDVATTVAAWQPLVAARATAHEWAQVPSDLVDAWLPLTELLLATTAEPVLLHGDANPGNLLAQDDGHRLTWRAIDPKPLVGDRAFDPWPLLEQVAPDPFAAADPVTVLAGRCAVVAEVIGSTPWRVAAWAFVRRVESNLWMADTTPVEERAESAADLGRQWDEARVWWRVVESLRT